MEKNKNTLLLTVIAIATLLVAVIGATFAYFTAQLSGSEDSSSVIVTAANLYIDYQGGTAVITSTDADTAVEPSKPTIVEGNITSATPFVTKSFSLTPKLNEGTEAFAYVTLPYTVNLVVTKNTFALDNDLTTASISYKLFNEGSKGIPTDTTFKPIAYYNAGGENPVTVGGNGKLDNITIYNNNGVGTTKAGVVLGTSEFVKGEAAAHTYRLEIYFLDDGTNQDADKGKEFSAYIDVSTGNLAISEPVNNQ